jgi:hypothetical protein
VGSARSPAPLPVTTRQFDRFQRRRFGAAVSF